MVAVMYGAARMEYGQKSLDMMLLGRNLSVSMWDELGALMIESLNSID